MTFSASDIPDLKDKVVIVTGANTGIGKFSALEMARKGAHVILACRSRDKTEPVVNEIKAQTKNESVEFMALDLASLKSVKEFAQAFAAKKLPIHVLLNNAGVMMIPNFTTTADGIEMQVGTNHVGHAYLTLLLLPIIKASAPSRIVCVSSLAHTFASESSFVVENFNDPKHYGQTSAYGNSKVANVFFARELNRRLEAEGVKNVYVNSLHPGAINSDLYRNLTGWQRFLMTPVLWFFMTVESGALTQLYVSTSDDIVSKDIRGHYFVPIAKDVPTTKLAESKEHAKKLWDYTDALIKEKMGPGAFEL